MAGTSAEFAQQFEAILQRLDSLEDQAKDVAFSLQEQVARAVEVKIDALRVELEGRIRSASWQVQEEIARVRRRVMALIAIVLAGLVAFWFAA